LARVSEQFCKPQQQGEGRLANTSVKAIYNRSLEDHKSDLEGSSTL